VGTTQYCSPEQLMGSRCYGAAVDMWALGCVMAELRTGQPLFEADTEQDVLEQIKDLRDEFSEIGLQTCKCSMSCRSCLRQGERSLPAF
jgi:cell division cycle 2-like protein